MWTSSTSFFCLGSYSPTDDDYKVVETERNFILMQFLILLLLLFMSIIGLSIVGALAAFVVAQNHVTE
nr:MAG TPA: hypothetical protein [Caudoviricetes sp.]